MSFSAPQGINRGAYEHPHSGVGIEYTPLGGALSEGQILIHEVGYLPRNERWMFPNTVSPFWRLYYNFDPGHRVVFRDHAIDLIPDHLVLIPDHQVFDSRGSVPVRHLWITFSIALSLRQGDSIVLPIQASERARAERMAQWVSHPSPRRRFHLLHEASALLHDVFLRQEIDWDERPRSPQVLKVAEHIAHHFAEPLEVPRLAQIAGISPRALATLFQREFRTTVPQFIARVRTREAARLLEQSPLSIDEIAERTGFPNRYYLTRVFTRVTGKPPARYRRESASTDREGPQAPSTPTTPQSDSTARDEQQSRG